MSSRSLLPTVLAQPTVAEQSACSVCWQQHGQNIPVNISSWFFCADTSAATATGPSPAARQQALQYIALALLHTLLAAATTLAPGWTLQHLLGFPVTTATPSQLMIAGGYLWLFASCLVCLKVWRWPQLAYTSAHVCVYGCIGISLHQGAGAACRLACPVVTGRTTELPCPVVAACLRAL